MKTRVDKEWFKNGKIKSEYNYKVGFSIPFTPFFKITFNMKEDGIENHWYKNGQKKEEINYKDGREDGLNTVGMKMDRRNGRELGRMVRNME